MYFVRSMAALLAAGLLVAGCAAANTTEDAGNSHDAVPGHSPSPHDPGVDAPSSAPVADLVHSLVPDDAPAVGAAVNAFGTDLLRQLDTSETNVVTSPVSVAAVLAMALAGADGATADAIAGVLHLDGPSDVRTGALLKQLTATDDVTLSVANGVWADDGVQLEDDYVAFVRELLGATAENADLGSPRTADDIDAWVDDHTAGRIDGIAGDLGLPDPQAVLLLLDAVYFLGEWTTAFDPADTRDAPFTRPDGSRVDAPLMFLRGQKFGYAEREGYRMLRLPYGRDGRFGMEVLLPDDGAGLPELLASLDAGEWADATSALSSQTLTAVALPRFELEWDAELTDALTRLGMGAALGPQADFRRMAPAVGGFDTIVHKTYIRVDENGTEAAAVTGGLSRTSAGPSFRVDRPFAFTISDQVTGTMLFLGAVADPTA